MINIKRVYSKPEKEDGFRVLVDRLWPRGLSKKGAKVDLWLKDIAPSNELREWFSHDIKKWADFQKMYWKELQKNQNLITLLKGLEDEKIVITLLFAARDIIHNNAVFLKKYLDNLPYAIFFHSH